MASQSTTVASRFEALSTRLWPELSDAPDTVRQQGGATLAIVLVNLPLVALALVWLVGATDIGVLRAQWPLLAFILVVLVLMKRQEFVIVLEFGKNSQLPITSSLAGMVEWTAVLMLGPSAIWLLWLGTLLTTVRWKQLAGGGSGRGVIWGPLATMVQEVGPSTLSLLCATWVYQVMGGGYPLAAASAQDWLLAAAATLVKIAATLFWLLPTMLAINRLFDPADQRQFIRRLWGSALVFMLLTYPFSIPLALTYGLGGAWLFVATSLGVLLANWLAHHLSRATLRAQFRARELAQLERQGADLLAAPADGSTLGSIVAENLPLLFPYYRTEVRLFASSDGDLSPTSVVFDTQHPPGDALAKPADWQALIEATTSELHFPVAEVLDPFNQDWSGISMKILGRVAENEQEQPLLGGIYLEYSDQRPTDDITQSMQELAGQIAAALSRAESYANNVARLRLTHELEMAGRIQASFLPDVVPELPGWDIAATLVPARQTAGDFYDFIPLPGGRLGIVVADVADKGTGAALYMALTRTLLRTYALEYPDQPELALEVTNDRILADTNSDQFVTVFYGVLEPDSGRFCYANAGHNPAFFLGNETLFLGNTGIPLGMFPDMKWSQRELWFRQGDLLCAYTDGVTEAPDHEHVEFGESRLMALLQSDPSRSAVDIQDAAIASIETWSHGSTEFDDITMLILRRCSE